MALRLTLRTLLAYLDDTLEPARAKEIGQKISESAQAQELIDRIRTVMRRRRLIANAADPDATEVDANDVAEYVDNMLDAERVAAFEHSCLESDMNLAEVASVHQILTLVLGKPADVSAEGRRRIHGLVEGAADQPSKRRPIGPKHASPTSPQAKVLAGESTSILMPIPPFETANPTGRFFSIFAVVSLSLALVVLIWMMLLPEKSSRETEVAIAGPREATPPEVAEDSTVPAAVDNDLEQPPVAAPSENGKPVDMPAKPGSESSTQTGSPAEPDSAAVVKDQPDQPPSTTVEEPRPAPAPKSDVASDLPLVSPAPAESAPVPAGQVEATKTPVSAEPTTPTVAVKPDERKEKMLAAKESGDLVPATPGPKTSLTDVKIPSETKSPSSPIDGVVPIATYTSNQGILFKRSMDTLIRMKKDSDFVFANDLLLNPTGFRSMLLLSNKATIELVDDTKFVVLGSSADGLRAEFPRGKLVVRLADKPLKMELAVGARSYRLHIRGDLALVGAQVVLQNPPVSDDQNRRGTRSLELFVARGEVELASGNDVVSVSGGHEVVVHEQIGVPQQKPTDNLPAWIHGAVSVVEERTAFKIAERVPYQERIEVTFREELSSPERGMRRLAIEGMATVGDLAGLVNGLVQPGGGDVREASIAALRNMMWNEPEQIPRVRAELAGVLNASNVALAMRYLLGFSDKAQADRETYVELVDNLESENQAIRQLAIYNLNELTGAKSFNFAADGTPSMRRNAVASWRRWLEREKTFPPKRTR